MGGLSVAAVLQIAFSIPAVGGTRVILISVDGLRSDVVTAERMPALSGLRSRGASGLAAWSDVPSVTMTNHASMLTGLDTGGHGVVLDFDLPGNYAGPTLFTLVKESGMRSGAFFGKSKLAYFTPDGATDVLVIDGDTASLVDHAAANITNDGPDLMVVHIRDPDSVGHARGWLSGMYHEAVAYADEQIGRLVEASEADSSRDTYFIVTADHGGEGLNHFLNIDANRSIPWIAAGPGIAAGLELTSEISTVDVAPTVLWLLGIARPVGMKGRTLMELKGEATGGDSMIAAIGAPCGLLAIPALWAAGCVLGRCSPVGLVRRIEVHRRMGKSA